MRILHNTESCIFTIKITWQWLFKTTLSPIQFPKSLEKKGGDVCIIYKHWQLHYKTVTVINNNIDSTINNYVTEHIWTGMAIYNENDQLTGEETVHHSCQEVTFFQYSRSQRFIRNVMQIGQQFVFNGESHVPRKVLKYR